MGHLIHEIVHIFVVVTIVDLFLYGIPIPRISRHLHKSQFFIQSKNRIEYQKARECAGYSTAYVFRHFGVDMDGLSAYQSIPFKLLHGNVAGMGIVFLCLKNKVKVRFRIGNLDGLKNSLLKGNPIVVLTKSAVGSNSLHYIVVVGYDDEYVYVVDSIESHKNCENEFYNRQIATAEFKKLWQTSMIYQPLFFHLFWEFGPGDGSMAHIE